MLRVGHVLWGGNGNGGEEARALDLGMAIAGVRAVVAGFVGIAVGVVVRFRDGMMMSRKAMFLHLQLPLLSLFLLLPPMPRHQWRGYSRHHHLLVGKGCHELLLVHLHEHCRDM